MDNIIQKITLSNFKGVSAQVVVLDPKTNLITGNNQSGKSTIVEAVLWVVYGKTAEGKEPVGIKPYDANGNEIHNLTTRVEITFDGFTLAKELVEVWQQKRGEAEKTLQGTKTTNFIGGDGYELATVGQIPYQTFVAERFGDFALLSIPGHFGNLKVTAKNQLLLNLINAPSDAELIPRLAPELSGLVGKDLNRVYDDAKKIASTQKKNVAAFEAAHKAAVELLAKTKQPDHAADADATSSLSDIDLALKEISENRNGILDNYKKANENRANTENEISAKKTELSKLDGKITEKQNDFYKKSQNEYRKKLEAANTASKDKTELLGKESKAKAEATALGTKKAELLTLWKNEHATVYDAKETTCPACKQSVAPVSQAAWTESKKEKLAAITKQGADIKAKIEQLERDAALYASQAAVIVVPEPTAPRFEDFLQAATDALASERKKIEAELKALETKLANIPTVDKGLYSTEALDAKEEHYQAERKKYLSVCATYDADCRNIENIKKQVEEALRTWQGAADALAEAARTIISIETYRREKNRFISDAVNSRFTRTAFVFEAEKFNGSAPDEVCDIVCIDKKGVKTPYVAANFASKIASDFEIISVFSEFFNIFNPVFVDNAGEIQEFFQLKNQFVAVEATKKEKTFSNIINLS